ncbi:vWA domain-containing protein [Nocardioides ultimimeridianus]
MSELQPDMFGAMEYDESSSSVFRSQVVILLDRSKSMSAYDRIGELEQAVRAFLAEDLKTLNFYHETELAIGAFNTTVEWLKLGPEPVRPRSPFYLMDRTTTLSERLVAGGTTRLVDAIKAAIRTIDDRAAELPADKKARRHKPQLFVITDGAADPDQDVDGMARILAGRAWHADSANMLFFALGVKGAHFPTLEKLAPQSSFDASTASLRELLHFVSESVNSSQTHASAPHAATDGARPFTPEYERVNQSLESMFAAVRRNHVAHRDL